ncbi:short-chain dehydrogenase TIC 32 B, chloroplastic-like isoform X3 [Musa acuminata AAA Group]|uniref:short-chain dehydrogenase TIC 32 B, chloroplastic-like isoform X3 n=1 Tax=Musa acuminata AAA Group TaxID=214697 RepID=UPI0031E3C72D
MLETVRYLIGSVGDSGFGSKSTGEEVTAAAPDLRSITAIITGATSGIGTETARVLAMRGARLVLPTRSLKTADEVKARIVAEIPDAEMAETARETGIQGRIVNVSSHVHSWFSGDCLSYLDRITRKQIPYDATQAYALSKLANILHTKELAERLKQMDANVTANCVHPGVVRTRLNRDREGFVTDLAFFLVTKLVKTMPQAAATACYVATHPRLVGISGRYFADCNEALPSPLASRPHEAAQLWRASESMTATDLDRTASGLEPQLASDRPDDEK